FVLVLIKFMETPQDILILANGPGEITTWVRPVVKEIRQQIGQNRDVLRISVLLAPCPNATGKEDAIALSYPEVDRVQGAKHFFKFLLSGKTAENWDWREQGAVIFLGGDQAFVAIIAKRLGYKSLIYAEWEARWYRWIDAYGVMNEKVLQQIPPRYRSKAKIVGDLMNEAGRYSQQHNSETEIIGLLPGSKGFKLKLGVPLVCAIASHLHKKRPQTRFILPVAPTLTLETLAQYGDRKYNSAIASMGNISAQMVQSPDNRTYLQTETGTKIELIQQFPAYDSLVQCSLCVTTLGANTAELGALGVPMLVMIPTQNIDNMRAWDGLPGILVNLPGIGTPLAKIINTAIVSSLQRSHRLFAWPNLWAGKEIVPEYLGNLQPEKIAQDIEDYLENPEKLAKIKAALAQVRGQTGAATQLAQILKQLLSTPTA
ncbi:MAG: lipid-A-disaccharide synthase, partial [Jaaginema sp. PMC 1079.18]|nr:lipid-A-disaccharide synthase [Jaaginema sp. PMC 1079.18]